MIQSIWLEIKNHKLMLIFYYKEFKIKMNHLDEKLFSSLNQKNLKNMVQIRKYFIFRVI